MTETKASTEGGFCWSEVCTTDAAEAKRFYGKLFGWGAQDTSVGDFGTYTMLRLGEAEIGGLYELGKEQRDANIRPHWLPYVRVEDVDGSVERARSLGGNVVMEPMDVMDMGRMALLQDPSGAVLAIWQAKSEAGGERPSGTGAPCWHELVSSDRNEANAFYAALFGWKLETWPGDYVLFKNGEQSVGGAMVAPQGVPSHWLTYFQVPSADAAARTATESGGEIVRDPHDVPEVGRTALLADPAGAIFGVFRFA